MVRLCGSTVVIVAFLPKNKKKKNCTFCFTCSRNEGVVTNLYLLRKEGDILILVLYVDDLFLTGAKNLVTSCKKDLAKEFEMKNLGLMHYFLGLEV
jgi:hypothetical protein